MKGENDAKVIARIAVEMGGNLAADYRDLELRHQALVERVRPLVEWLERHQWDSGVTYGAARECLAGWDDIPTICEDLGGHVAGCPVDPATLRELIG